MKCRAIIEIPGREPITVQYKARHYLEAITAGRTVIVRRAQAILESKTKFRWATQFMNRRMQWQYLEYGGEDHSYIIKELENQRARSAERAEAKSRGSQLRAKE